MCRLCSLAGASPLPGAESGVHRQALSSMNGLSLCLHTEACCNIDWTCVSPECVYIGPLYLELLLKCDITKASGLGGSALHSPLVLKRQGSVMQNGLVTILWCNDANTVWLLFVGWF